MNFIEVTNTMDNSTMLININHIDDVIKNKDGSCRIICDNNYSTFIPVGESYEEIKEKIQHASIYKLETREDARKF